MATATEKRLLHATAVVAQHFALLAQVLGVLLALVRHVQAIGLLQGALGGREHSTHRAHRESYTHTHRDIHTGTRVPALALLTCGLPIPSKGTDSV